MKIAVIPFESSSVERTDTIATVDYNVDGVKSALPDEDICAAMTNQDAFHIYTNTRMYKAMKPLFISLRIFGLYYSRKCGMLKECARKSRSKRFGEDYKKNAGQHFPTPSMFYSMFLLVLFIVNYFRLFTMFAGQSIVIGVDLFTKCVTVAWFTLSSLNFVMFFRAAFRYEGIPKFFIEWDKILQSSSMGIDHIEKGVKRMTWITVIVIWMIMLIGSTLIIYPVIAYPSLTETILVPFTPDHPYAWIMKIIVCVFQPLINAPWTFAIGYDFMFCFVLYKMFENWANDFRKKCATGMSSSEFEQLQLQHQRICRLVGHVDEFLSLYKATCFICSIAVLLFIMYILIYFPAEFRTTTITVFFLGWLLGGALCLVTNCMTGIMVNTMVS